MKEDKERMAKGAAEALEFLTRGKHIIALFFAQLGLLFGLFYLLRSVSPLDPMICATVSAVFTITISALVLGLLIRRFSRRKG